MSTYYITSTAINALRSTYYIVNPRSPWCALIIIYAPHLLPYEVPALCADGIPACRQVACGRAVACDAAGGGDVVRGDRVSKVEQDVGVNDRLHSGNLARLQDSNGTVTHASSADNARLQRTTRVYSRQHASTADNARLQRTTQVYRRQHASTADNARLQRTTRIYSRQRTSTADNTRLQRTTQFDTIFNAPRKPLNLVFISRHNIIDADGK